jgi:hypothetical protein
MCVLVLCCVRRLFQYITDSRYMCTQLWGKLEGGAAVDLCDDIYRRSRVGLHGVSSGHAG